MDALVRFRVRPALLVGSLLLGAVVATLTGAAGASTQSAQSLASSAMKNAQSGGWVHEVVITTSKGAVARHSTNNIGATESVQVVTTSHGGASTLIAFSQRNTLYVHANSAALSRTYKLSATSAQRYANEWLRLPSSNARYAAASAGTTLASRFGALQFSGTVSWGQVGTISGVRVRALTGTIAATSSSPKYQATLYVTTSGTVLPVGLREVSGTTDVTVEWSNWGHAYAIQVPAPAVNFPSA
ncbi:MAG TPA: hypothetical protein VGZ68_11340 [Acidimicrobiales bacterium]|jgi:hypothetical protein|nr:hypothetical protein [Acidimicrobiales bacterium]